MRFLRRSIIGLFLTAATLGLLAFAIGSVWQAAQASMNAEQRSFPARERVFAVNAITIEPQEITPVLTVFGEVVSRRVLEIRSSVSGAIIEVSEQVQEGGAVTAGTLLFRIDPTDAQADLSLVRADVREAEADQRDAVSGLSLAQDELAAAREQVALRERALTRQRDLVGRGVGTEAALETAELAASSARQQVLARRQAIQTAQSRVAQAGNRLERLIISVTEAERALANTEIRASFGGVLTDVSVAQGGQVGPNDQLARLVDPKALEVAFRVSTSQYQRLIDEAGALRTIPVSAALDVFGVDLTAEGRVTRESPAVGEGQTGRLLFATLSNPVGLRAGDFLTVSLEEPPLRGVSKLPASAVGADSTVLVISDEARLSEAEVVVMRRQGDDVLVRARGLGGQQIVAERSPLLGAGIKVRPIAPDGAIPEAPAMVELSDERRAKIVAFIEANTRMPAEAKARVLSQLEENPVPARVVERIESRMGG